MEHNNPIVGQFVSTLMASRTQAHIFHLQTPSFAAHMALQAYYEGIVPLIDGLVESYQGKNGIITGYGNIALQEYESCEAIIMFFETLCTYIEKTPIHSPECFKVCFHIFRVIWYNPFTYFTFSSYV